MPRRQQGATGRVIRRRSYPPTRPRIVKAIPVLNLPGMERWPRRKATPLPNSVWEVNWPTHRRGACTVHVLHVEFADTHRVWVHYVDQRDGTRHITGGRNFIQLVRGGNLDYRGQSERSVGDPEGHTTASTPTTPYGAKA